MEDRKAPKPVSAQKRNFVRVDVLLPVSFNVVNEQSQRLRRNAPNLGCSVNLSSGGMLLATDRELPTGTRLLLTFPLFEGEAEVWTDALVLVSQRQQEGALKKFLCHLSFDSPDKDTQDKIMKFIFEKQRSLRRQGIA